MSGSNHDDRSAKERLQASREALVEQLRGRASPRRTNAAMHSDDMDGASTGTHPQRASSEDSEEPSSISSRASSIWSAAKYGIRAWWEFHPVRAVGAIAEPLVADYAERRPFRLLGIAAGVGATLVVVKPWRLISIGGLAVAALKSSQVSSFVLSLISQPQNNHKDAP